MSHDTASCAAQHFGPWAVELDWLRQAVAAYRAGALPVVAATKGGDKDEPAYIVSESVATVALHGQMTKYGSSFGGASSVRTRAALRQATNDSEVQSIVMHIDSPGGTVAGTQDLADDVRAAAAVKPVHAYIEDLGASAAYWVASQASKVYANATALVGSIGTLAIIEDMSGAAEKAGITVHVVSTGAYKGAFADGAPVTDEHLEYAREMVNDLNQHFLAAVKRGRGLNAAGLRAVSDGRMWVAEKAKELGLIDGIQSLDATMAGLRPKARRAATQPTALAAMSQRRRRLSF